MKKRTRQQKIKAAERRAQQPAVEVVSAASRSKELNGRKEPSMGAASSGSVPPVSQTQVSSEQTQREAYAHELFHFDTSLIYSDLRKTIILVASIFIFLGLIARFWLGR
jgi:hypothetical protein